MSAAPLNVLIVDDSAAIRSAFASIVREDPGLSLMGAAADPYEAAKMMRDTLPDVMLLDLELPKMDGLTFLRKIMSQRPLPVVVCSSHTESGSQAMIKALESGAAEVLAKPRFDSPEARREAAIRLGDALRAAVAARKGRKMRPDALSPGEKFTADVILPYREPVAVPQTAPLIAIGASTGGTEALREVLTALPADAPGIVIVQHMPEAFTGAFARRLDGLCQITVKEAETGDTVAPGLALIAPGNRHMVLRRVGRGYQVSLLDGPYVTRHRPSVDVLFRSTAQQAGANALGIILTGMGSDGAAGMLEMYQNGARTIAQDEATCVVYGMPREAFEMGGAERQLPLGAIPAQITSFTGATRPKHRDGAA
ncbi:two-component system chemotaxis response regulator CheB [Rhodobacter sp. JA431]|uniref:protein-glutamate methylesterase/protein-glutamine glutaminase n=1 Tax=Rhodobacter sp. JA431 TaxID=570013 RepID=UPI000BCBD886|nr:chemotaxis response regulator protein-glutamate methylesterase [Rhodobacter sp. JA431]SOC15996.1 two-component system chemotaxis response regulator CheB [Rhodobacter sp. JA431]